MKKYDISIIASEKTIEDILCDNMQKYLGLKFISRQYETPAGIIDIIAKHPIYKDVYYIIELKKGIIDTHAYAQVHRYCQYMNNNMSKDGLRRFIPFVIGDSLSEELYKNVIYFEDETSITDTLYRIYNFNPLTGISFTYFYDNQIEYANDYLKNYNYINKLEDDIAVLEWRLIHDR